MWGDILSTMGDVQYCGGYHECQGVILSTVGDMMHLGDFMTTVGVFSIAWDTILCNLSAMGYHDTCGDIISTMGCSVPWEYANNKKLFPTVLNTPTVLMTSPMVLKITPHDTHDIPHGTDQPPQ